MTCTKISCYSPCVVQVPDHPPRRLRCPLDLVRGEVYCHLKAVYRLIRQNLRHHHHCRHPEEEGGQKSDFLVLFYIIHPGSLHKEGLFKYSKIKINKIKSKAI